MMHGGNLKLPVLMVVKFTDVIHFTVNGFKLGMYSLMMAWLC